ncbi:hypothetical protein HN695_03070 [Candidatus Woesearchaeota archaeon]|jgi:hypothetical protein|nr:hypothetical protein [Candidatus Woesearchaeota archaeon]MBT5271759.1 hypothetical protein [Candidatus Woesearchaeota archaeon]MBT6041562.1 hypothetical protein [Candidatus Woesearchaeota archaeon]MBT6337377.1 hypothetical protein [Candidatus Woesearchaeota archaeon]MBT7927293.1 hypothetical protein [Candidatus Woesearchaeota archaeon]
MKITKKHVIFLVLFAALVFIGRRVNFSPLVGADNQFFTLFQFFGPIAGAFLGPIVGAISVLIAHGTDYIIAGKAFTLVNIVRLTPMIFAAIYFGSRKKLFGKPMLAKIFGVVIPLIAMIAFIMHPVGREAWLYAMFWWVPIIVAILPTRYSDNLILKSFGATFVAHSIGSVAWLYTFPMSPAEWLALMPVVVFERSLFAMGIIGSYFGMNAVLHKVTSKFKIPSDILHVDKSYLISRLFKAKA